MGSGNFGNWLKLSFAAVHNILILYLVLRARTDILITCNWFHIIKYIFRSNKTQLKEHLIQWTASTLFLVMLIMLLSLSRTIFIYLG